MLRTACNSTVLLPLTLTLVLLGGCVAEDNDDVLDLGSVSIGQQLIDLKAARDAGAVSADEYDRLRKGLIAAVTDADDDGDHHEDDHDDDSGHHDDDPDDDDGDDEEEDDDDGWLF